eukprot:CAMPEP_0194294984 /NCGR_PEP_ID=MMETSP0169-20130528/52311_1 /TAXON_ID=218684 /ORGANISM="Corethron pennatum, Strain L29A3" /LENGTH=168 /DNA_ID=CAMNT_0039044047 /DNA_START=27 /DNA_END=533 /DNA_ORIENTATION=-
MNRLSSLSRPSSWNHSISKIPIPLILSGTFQPKVCAPLTIRAHSTGRRPRRALPPPVNVTDAARAHFLQLLQYAPGDGDSLLLCHRTSSDHIGRFVYSFDFISPEDVDARQPPKMEFVQLKDEGDRRLYVDDDSLMKVLGATVDVESEDGMLVPSLFDREGNLMDPNN